MKRGSVTLIPDMKTYNRDTKIWEEPKKDSGKPLKKRELCRGGKPHDFQLVLPQYRTHSNPNVSQEAIKAYYDTEDAIQEFSVAKAKELLDKYGINMRQYSFFGHQTRWIECTVCGKRDYLK